MSMTNMEQAIKNILNIIVDALKTIIKPKKKTRKITCKATIQE